MKKLIMVAVAGALTFASCGEKKDFCECITEAMLSENPEEVPAGCEYIETMDEAEAQEKAMECLSEIMGEMMQGMEGAFDDMGDAFGDAMDDMGAEMDEMMDEMSAEIEEMIEE